jgi:hypothetical protein
MADPLYELLAPYFNDATAAPAPRDAQSYLARLSTLSFHDLTSSEPSSLLQSAQSHLRSLQALSKRSHRAVISSSTHLANLGSLLPALSTQAQALGNDLPELESAATDFAEKYDRSSENAVLDRRKRAALLSRNVDRVSDVLDLPSLLSSTVSAAQAGTAGGPSPTASTTSYATALDVHAHIRRLRALYPQSELVGTIAVQSEAEMQNLASILITSLQSPSLKLAAAMRTIGLIRRVAPELVGDEQQIAKPLAFPAKPVGLASPTGGSDGALCSLFLVCRLHMLHKTLEALDPLRDLADQETTQRLKQLELAAKSPKQSNPNNASQGSQSERYLKRYVEIYREQSFGILSMYKSIFPSDLPEPDRNTTASVRQDPLLPLPSPVSSFALHLVEMLEDTLREYLPNVVDTATRESLLTQVLYCAGSLGRLGAEFGMMVALLEDDLAEQQAADEKALEWVLVMKKHRVQASRLEILARGVGGPRKVSMDVPSPSSTSPTPTPLATG